MYLHNKKGDRTMEKILCPKCKCPNIAKKGFRHNKSGKKQKFQCTKCKAWFVYDDGFKRMRKPKEAITRALHQINDGMSLSKVQNHLFQHDNIKVSRAGVLYWIKKYSQFIKKTSSHL